MEYLQRHYKIMSGNEFRFSLTTEQHKYIMEEVDYNLKRAIAYYEKYGVEMPLPVLTAFIGCIEMARSLGSSIGYRQVELSEKAHECYKKVDDELVNRGYKRYLVDY